MGTCSQHSFEKQLGGLFSVFKQELQWGMAACVCWLEITFWCFPLGCWTWFCGVKKTLEKRIVRKSFKTEHVDLI